MSDSRSETEVSGSRGVRHDRLQQLMTRVIEGDRDAFAQVYDETAPTVYGTAVRIMRDPGMAEEVTQEVMIEAWTRASSYDPARGSVFAWIATIGHRRAVDRVRTVEAGRRRDEKFAQEQYGRPYDDAGEAAEKSAEHARLHRCLENVTEVQRAAILRAYWGGETYKAVSRALGVNESTMKTRIRDGLNRLRNCLGVE